MRTFRLLALLVLGASWNARASTEVALRVALTFDNLPAPGAKTNVDMDVKER